VRGRHRLLVAERRLVGSGDDLFRLRWRRRSGKRDRIELVVEILDDRLELFVARQQRVNELVLLQRFELFAERKIGVAEETRGNDVAGIELQRFGQRLDEIGRASCRERV